MSLENPLFGSREGREEVLKAKAIEKPESIMTEHEAINPEPIPKPLETSSVESPEPEKPDFKFQVDVKPESLGAIKAERVKPERSAFQKKSLEELTQNGDKRIEAAKQKFINLKTSIVGGFSSVFRRVKGTGQKVLETAVNTAKATPGIVASMPELTSYAVEAGKAKVQESYHTVADAVQGKIAETKFQFSKGYREIVDKTKDIYEGVELRGVDALRGFNGRVQEIIRRTGENLDSWRNTSEATRLQEKEQAIRDLITRAEKLGLKITL